MKDFNGLGQKVGQNKTDHLLFKVETQKDIEQIQKDMGEAKIERNRIWESIDCLNKMAYKVLGGVLVISIIVQIIGVFIIAKIVK